MSIVGGLLNQEVASICSVSIDGYGDSTKTVLYINTPCRWEEKVDQITTSRGETVAYNAEMWVYPDVTVRKNYRITKDMISLETYIVVGVEKRYNLDGKHDHTKVFLS